MPESIPGDSLSLVATAVDTTCSPIDSFRIQFKVGVIPYTGGHGHNANTPNATVTPDTGRTDQNGQLATKFCSPVDTCGQPGDGDGCERNLLRGIAGIYIVEASSRDYPGVLDILFVSSKVPGLDSLPNSQYYVKVGQTPPHPLNHWGTPYANRQLAEIGQEFDSTLVARGHNPPDVMYNDQGLEWGGMFDIGPTKYHPEWRLWHCPHCGHHDGTTCDINKFRQTFFDTTLERIIRDHGTIDHDDDFHWDVRF